MSIFAKHNSKYFRKTSRFGMKKLKCEKNALCGNGAISNKPRNIKVKSSQINNLVTSVKHILLNKIEVVFAVIIIRQHRTWDIDVVFYANKYVDTKTFFVHWVIDANTTTYITFFSHFVFVCVWARSFHFSKKEFEVTKNEKRVHY